MDQRTIERLVLYSFIVLLILLIGITWGLSFDPPPKGEDPLKWIYDNKLGLFFGYIISYASVVILFILMMVYFPNDPTSDIDEPLAVPELLFLAATLLLLSSFFIIIDPEQGRSRFYDTYPLIFYTTFGLIFLGIASLTLDHIATHNLFSFIRAK